MTKLAAVLAIAALMQPVLSAAGASTDSRSKPSSFVPHAHTNNHVYGSPIQPAIMGHSQSHQNQKHAPLKKRSSSSAHRSAQ